MGGAVGPEEPTAGLPERDADQLAGVIACFDRIVRMGTLSVVGRDGGMESLLRRRGIEPVEYSRFVEFAHAVDQAEKQHLELERGDARTAHAP